jgi:hypothetical protein
VEEDDGNADKLYHPARVAGALASIEALGGEDELVRVLRITDRRVAGYLPTEVLVRLVRRCRKEKRATLEREALRALLQRATGRVRKLYCGLGAQNVEDFAQDVVVRLLEALKAKAGIDYWEVSFETQLRRAAATVYQEKKPLYRGVPTADIDDLQDTIGDGWAQAAETKGRAILKGLASNVLDRDERQLFLLMFVERIPINSANASVDLVRLTGQAESTLRNLKTVIKRKLRGALEKDMD